MPANLLQDRIRQFESLNHGAGRPVYANGASAGRSRPSYPPISVRTNTATFTGSSASSSASSDLLGEPVSPIASSYTVIKPNVPYVPRKPRPKQPSPPSTSANQSLIDLKDWIVTDGPNAPSNLKLNGSQPAWSVPKIGPLAPALPPRISSQNSGASSSTSHSSHSNPRKSPAPNTLSVDHSYPPASKSGATPRQKQGHIPASSTSSFHSVSLSSDGDGLLDSANTEKSDSVTDLIATYPMDISTNTVNGRGQDQVDSDSVNSSFEQVSSPNLSLTHEWEKDFSMSMKMEPPQHPSRQSSAGSFGSNRSTPSHSQSPKPPSSPTPSFMRRVPPPPPPSRTAKPPPGSSRASVMSNATTASDRSSLFSLGTVTTAHTSINSCAQLLRPTPVPIVARKRYEAVFFANINAQRRSAVKRLSPAPSAGSSPMPSQPSTPTMPRKGWRGVSVDLVTNPEERDMLASLAEDVEGNRLDGRVVQSIWRRSHLQAEKLKEVWNECAFPGQSSLDREGFVKGMWRIDEELNRVQTMRSSTLTVRDNFRPSRAPQRRTTTESTISLLN